MIGAIGDDADGELVRAALADRASTPATCTSYADAPTGRALITVDDHGGNAIVVSPGANAQLTEDDISAGLRHMGAGDLLLLQLETPEPLVRHAARTAAEAGGAGGAQRRAGARLRSTDCSTTSMSSSSTNTNSPASQHLLRTAPTAARDDDMALLAAASNATRHLHGRQRRRLRQTRTAAVEHIEAPPVEAVDTTAAGDTFIGYLRGRTRRGPARPRRRHRNRRPRSRTRRHARRAPSTRFRSARSEART